MGDFRVLPHPEQLGYRSHHLKRLMRSLRPRRLARGCRVQVAKNRSGAAEDLRVLRTTRKDAVKCRRAILQQLHNTIVAAPNEVRDRIRKLHSHAALAYLCGLEAGYHGIPGSGPGWPPGSR